MGKNNNNLSHDGLWARNLKECQIFGGKIIKRIFGIIT